MAQSSKNRLKKFIKALTRLGRLLRFTAAGTAMTGATVAVVTKSAATAMALSALGAASAAVNTVPAKSYERIEHIPPVIKGRHNAVKKALSDAAEKTKTANPSTPESAPAPTQKWTRTSINLPNNLSIKPAPKTS